MPILPTPKRLASNLEKTIEESNRANRRHRQFRSVR